MECRKFLVTALLPLSIVLIITYANPLAKNRLLTTSKSTIVSTDCGKVNGTIETSRHSKSYIAFRGIPYAKPPLGDLRFKPPQESDRWEGIRNAHQFSNSCIQKDILTEFSPKTFGSEDCLYLNVYTPQIRKKTLLPVMVFIHYGAFVTGNGNERLGPTYFMDKQVVLVTFNYRIGFLGFMCTGDDASPGNYAFKDQNAVLKWVQRNIKEFGGDPDKVTLFGQSAGAGSTHLQMLSPLSKGLFHRAICQSGSALALWATPSTETQVGVTQKIANDTGCLRKNTVEMVDCLRQIDAEVLVNVTETSLKLFFMEPINIFTPVIEKLTESNPEPFLTKLPLQYIIEGDYNKVPWIIGTVRDEGVFRVSPFFRNEIIRTPLTQNFDTLASALLGVQLSVKPEEAEEVWQNMTLTFMGPRTPTFLNDTKSIQGYINLYTDRAFMYSSYQSALMHATRGHDNIYLYSFEYKGKLSYGDPFALTDNDIDFDWGVCHCDDLVYLFTSSLFDKEITGVDRKVSEVLIQMWVNFATTGDPTPMSQHPWEPMKLTKSQCNFEKEIIPFLNISGPYPDPNESFKLRMNYEYHNDRISYWKSLPLLENAINEYILY